MTTLFFRLLTICGLEELKHHGTRGVTHVLSILDPQTPDPAFAGYAPHARTLLRFDDIVVPEDGKVLPARADVEAILAYGRTLDHDAAAAGHLLVHCHAGISRSTAATIMILAQAEPGTSESDLVDRVGDLRPQAWPNLRMIQFADDLLAREGRLVQAVATLYRRRLAARPELAEALARLHRTPELVLAETGVVGPPA